MPATQPRLEQISGDGTAATKNAPASGNASATEVVLGNDTRLTDSRTPTTHTHPLSALTQSSATTGQVAKWNGSAWAAADDETAAPGSGLTAAQVMSRVTLGL